MVNWSGRIPLWFYVLNNAGFVVLVFVMWWDLKYRGGDGA